MTRLSDSLSPSEPIPVAQFMAVANARYRDSSSAPKAAEGGKIFGELVGLWLADLWLRMKKPKLHYVELNHGSGAFSADVLRAMALVGLKPQVHFVGIKPGQNKPHAAEGLWHDDIATLPGDAPLLVIARDFFSTLPIEQLAKGPDGWHQRLVACQNNIYVPALGKLLRETIVPEGLRDAGLGNIIETSPVSVSIICALAERFIVQGGATLVFDHGYDGPQLGDTLRAFGAQTGVSPFDAPGNNQLVAQVDFETLGAMAELCGASVHGPAAQGKWLNSLGLAERVAAQTAIKPETAITLETERALLAGESKPGPPPRVLAIVSPDWPIPDGF